MSEKRIIISFFILIVAVRIEAQFFDFFSDLRPFTYQTVKPIFQFQDSTTKKSKTTYQRYNGEELTSSYDGERDGNRQITREKARRKTTTTTTTLYDVQFLTTQKPRRLKNVTRNDYNNHNVNSNNNRHYSNNNGNNENNNYDYNNRRPWQEANVIDYTARPYETTRNNKYTTYNPLYNRPGVKPALVDNNKPPITNRPATQRPLAVYPRPTDASVIRFPESLDTSPPVLTGPDEDSMSSAERRRYLDIAEKMCDKYKSLSIKKVEFIPLLPSPQAMEINVTDCEVASVPLVVGGKVASIREFPHMALLGWTRLKKGGYAWKCGGSLVSDQYVLTAAHCSFQNRDMDVASGAPRVVQLGSSYLDDTGALVIKVSSVIRHPKYSQSRSYYDIALVKLVKPVTFSAVVKPACLGVPPPVGEKVIATGWGRTEFGGDQSLELRSVSIPIWEMKDCARILGITRKMPAGPAPASQLCAGEKAGGKDTCQGDSGGPAQIQDGCVWRIVGVTSVGRSCGAVNTPAIYARVLREFIAAQIFKDQVNNRNNNEDYGSDSQNSGSNYQNTGASSQNSGSNRQHYESNNQNYGLNNQNSGNNRQNYDNQNFGSNNDNNKRNSGNDYINNNSQTNDGNRQSNLYNNANNNRQTGNNYDRNQRNNVYNNRNTDNNYENRPEQGYNNQKPNDRSGNNNYQSQNVNKPSTTNNYDKQNGNRNNNNNYESNRNNNGMINFDNHNSFSTNRPSTSNYFANSQDYYNPKSNYGKRDYRVTDDNEDIIYWPEA